jgi:hypothetical protein
MTTQTATLAPPLGQGTTNTTPGSVVRLPVAPEPQAYLRLDTGEVIVVPATDHTALHNEFDKWNRLVYEQMLANDVLAMADDRLLAIALAIGSQPMAISRDIQEDARRAQRFALEWRQQATEALRQETQALDKLGSGGKKLVEMIPLMDKDGDKPYALSAAKGNGEWKRKATDLTRAWGFKSGVGLRAGRMAAPSACRATRSSPLLAASLLRPVAARDAGTRRRHSRVGPSRCRP